MNHDEIKAHYLDSMDSIRNTVTEFPWEAQQAYALWLAQSYFFVRHSTRLLALAAAYAPFTKNKTHRRMSEHIPEEIGHELIAAGDLKRLGFDMADFNEMAETKEFYDRQYTGIREKSSSYLMGYILFLEGLAIIHGPQMLKRIEVAHGQQASRFLKLHVEEDQSHIESAFKNLEIQSQTDFEAVTESLSLTLQGYSKILERIVHETQNPGYVSASQVSSTSDGVSTV